MNTSNLIAMDPEQYVAATSGDTGFLTKIGPSGVPAFDIEQKTPNKSSVFHVAAEFKQIGFFKDVPLEEKSFPLFWDVNNKGDTPLHVAARVGCNEIVKFLVDQPKTLHNRGADQESGQTVQKKLLQMTNWNKDTALHVATRYDHVEVVKLLMEADPELCSLTNSANESPLFLAIRQHSVETAAVLIECSVSPSFEGINGVTALHAAVNHSGKKAKEIVKTIVSKYPDTIEKTDELGWTPLHYAALSGNVEASRLLMEGSSSVAYMLDKSGMSALHVAAYAGHSKVIEELIQHWPDTCHLVNHKGQTILHAAVMGGQRSTVNWILVSPKLGALINEADNDGNTPLHLAAIYGDTSIAICLIQRGADKTAINKELSMAADLLPSNNTRKMHSRMGGFAVYVPYIGVPFFQQKIRCDFMKLDSPENDIPGTPTIADKREILQTHSHEDLKVFDTKLLVAMLIATVTFAAAFTVPGGFKSDGMAVLHGKLSFQLFMSFNALSFFLSIIVVFQQFLTATVFGSFIADNDNLIQYSVAGMIIAFASGMFVVLPKNSPLGIVAYVMCSYLCVVVIYGFREAIRERRGTGKIQWLRTRIM